MSLEVKIKKKLKEFTLESELNVETGCTGLMLSLIHILLDKQTKLLYPIMRK